MLEYDECQASSLMVSIYFSAGREKRSICVQMAHPALLNPDSLLSQTSTTLTSQLLPLRTLGTCLTDKTPSLFSFQSFMFE